MRAVILNAQNVVTNVVVADASHPAPPGYTLLVSDAGQIGETYDPGTQTFLPAPPPPPPQGPWFYLQPGDLSTSLNTLVDVPGWALELRPNKRYRFDLTLTFRTAATATGVHFTVNGPASPVGLDVWLQTSTSLSAMNLQRITAYDGGAPTGSIDAANADRLALMRGLIITGDIGGPLKLRARSEVNGSLVTLRQGSFAEVWVV